MQIKELYQHFIQSRRAFIDSRQASQGGIFFSVGQKSADGRRRSCQFAPQAIADGADWAVIDDADLYEQSADRSRLVLVEDTELCLQQLAAHHRRQLNNTIFIAIAGSNGKTTSRELLFRVLAKKGACFATPSNLNNHIGLPLSVLQVQPSHQFAIIEIGANHLNETLMLAHIAQPHIGLVTNNGKDHLGEYGSLENIARANAELYQYLQAKKGLAVVNRQDLDLMQRSEKVKSRIFYGQGSSCWAKSLPSFWLKAHLYLNGEEYLLRTHLFGDFWLDSLLGVVRIGLHLGVAVADIIAGIEGYKPENMRSQLLTWESNELLLDCYNANPSSMGAFIQAIQQQKQANSLQLPVLILGEMLELGNFSRSEHQQILHQIEPALYLHILLVGEGFKHLADENEDKIRWFADAAAAQSWLSSQQLQNRLIFVKGSRGNKLEQIFGLK